MFQAISANVSTEGQSLFLALSKMINEVRWRNSEIIIWDQEVQDEFCLLLISLMP